MRSSARPVCARFNPATPRPLQTGERSGTIHLLSEDGKRVAMDVKKGDKIIYAKYAGTEIKINDEELLIIRESDILAKIG